MTTPKRDDDGLPPVVAAAPDRTVTVTDVAARAGVSRASVSYALTKPQRASKSMVERVTRAATELGYVGNDAARQLRVGHGRAIGMIVLDAVNPVFADVASGAEDAARDHGRFLFVANSNQDADREREYIGFFESQRVSGIIISPVSRIPPELREMEARGTPFVMVGEVPESRTANFVTGDDEHGGYIAMRHLVEQGRRRLLLVTGPHDPIWGRIRGARRAAEEVGAVVEVWTTEKQSIDSGARAAARLVDERGPIGLPDGILAGNDLLALGILQQLLKSGVSVPQDVSLVGYDDLEFARTAMVPLTSVRQPVKLMGSTAVELLLSLVAGGSKGDRPTQLRFQPELIVRKSSAG